MNIILNLVDKYGLPLILLLVILKWLKPKLDDLWNLFLNKNDDYDEAILRKLLEAETEISILLKEMYLKFGACRSVIWQFHNGVKSVNGIPFLRMSVTHEQTDLVPTMSLFQNIPTSLLSKLTKDLLNTGTVTIHLNNTKYDSVVGIMRDIGIKTNIYLPIRDHRGCFFGIVTISFLEETTLTDKEIANLEEYAHRLSIVLESMVIYLPLKTYKEIPQRKGHRYNDRTDPNRFS